MSEWATAAGGQRQVSWMSCFGHTPGRLQHTPERPEEEKATKTNAVGKRWCDYYLGGRRTWRYGTSESLYPVQPRGRTIALPGPITGSDSCRWASLTSLLMSQVSTPKMHLDGRMGFSFSSSSVSGANWRNWASGLVLWDLGL